ncbi:PepSY-associated TM helix domain-containing protein [Novosphingobium malaysiense]|uniref:Peptidase n=1 Tax=Novosphingobium malaysiense TaxID=1348853 RepID=A0A0B1ZKZ0_9SPHN|nr:PepSY-associated TM helix domain-containing protein [Novosphingobium malaysiense]KHK89945.1 hypothetical protein LK12_18810 [Novosphingobium malaysiense]
MRLLTTLHRWLGATMGLILIVTGLSGSALVWESWWIGVPGARAPVTGSVASLARSVDIARDHHPGLTRITFASEDIGLHQAAYLDGSGAYIDQSGNIAASWSSIWQRPELWLFDLHHYLFAGRFGEILVGTAGLICIFFVVSGIILWWRTRRTFSFRLWPRRLTRSAIVRQHRDMGLLLAPLLLLATITGAAMIFPQLSRAITAPWPDRMAHPQSSPRRIAHDDWAALLTEARRTFPQAEIRRLQYSAGNGAAATLRLRQPFEWTPNGRTYLKVDRSGTVKIEAPDGSLDKQAISEKFYPIHAAKVGGWVWKAVVTCAGLGLVMLGALATFSFWLRAPTRTI